jgi:hypothetical protein
MGRVSSASRMDSVGNGDLVDVVPSEQPSSHVPKCPAA